VPITDLDEWGLFLCANSDLERASRMKTAAGWRVYRARNLSVKMYFLSLLCGICHQSETCVVSAQKKI
jgi:hypothetical protein